MMGEAMHHILEVTTPSSKWDKPVHWMLDIRSTCTGCWISEVKTHYLLYKANILVTQKMQKIKFITQNVPLLMWEFHN